MADGHIRRPMLPWRSNTKRGARGIVPKYTTLPPPTQFPPSTLIPSPATKSKMRVEDVPSLKSCSNSSLGTHGPRSRMTTLAPPAARW